MAADDDDKQHPASGKQREKFASEGDVARSRDLAAAVTFAGAVMLFTYAMGGSAKRLTQSMQSVMREVAQPADAALFHRMMKLYAQTTAPFFATSILLAIALGFWQHGYTIPFRMPSVRFPLANFIPKLLQLFAIKESGVNLLSQLGKMLVLAWACGSVLRQKIPPAVQHVPGSLHQGLRLAADILGSLVKRAAIVYLVIGLLDYWLNWWKLEQRMKMSSQQIKDEAKDAGGDGRTKSRMRSMHAKIVQQRSMQEVSAADAIVVNPTHYAVAILYDAKRMEAPTVVAKGADAWAERIRSIGRHHSVPIISQPVLARALFAKVETGQGIPEELYQAVALLLAHVYRIRPPRR